MPEVERGCRADLRLSSIKAVRFAISTEPSFLRGTSTIVRNAAGGDNIDTLASRIVGTTEVGDELTRRGPVFFSPVFYLMYIFPCVYGNHDATLRILPSRPLWS